MIMDRMDAIVGSITFLVLGLSIAIVDIISQHFGITNFLLDFLIAVSVVAMTLFVTLVWGRIVRVVCYHITGLTFKEFVKIWIMDTIMRG
jgi:hypothetical protein